MRRLLLIAVASIAALAVAGPPAASAAASCRGLTVDGLEITKVRASGMGCLDARRLARAWVRSEDCNPAIGGPEECTLRRSTCTNTEGPGYNSTVVCRRSGRRVSFRVGP